LTVDFGVAWCRQLRYVSLSMRRTDGKLAQSPRQCAYAFG
jgi:hypothetical protein